MLYCICICVLSICTILYSKNYSNFGLRHIYLLNRKKKNFNKKTWHDEHLFVFCPFLSHPHPHTQQECALLYHEASVPWPGPDWGWGWLTRHLQEILCHPLLNVTAVGGSSMQLSSAAVTEKNMSCIGDKQWEVNMLRGLSWGGDRESALSHFK